MLATRLLLLAVLAMLAACAPEFVGGNARSVTIGNITGLNDAKALQLADAHCAKYGLIARPAMTNARHATTVYDCVP